MNSDQLIKFKTIVECGTVSQAAEKLFARLRADYGELFRETEREYSREMADIEAQAAQCRMLLERLEACGRGL